MTHFCYHSFDLRQLVYELGSFTSRDAQQLWQRQNSAPEVHRVDPDTYEDLTGDRKLEAPADFRSRMRG